MADDDEHEPTTTTAPPPPGEEDLYSASTVVGEASDELLAIIRESKAIDGAPKEDDSPTPEVPPVTMPMETPLPTAVEEEEIRPAENAEPAAPIIATTTAAVSTPAKGGLPPAFGIVLFFVIVCVVLVVLVR